MKAKIKDIRPAILAHCGGLTKATDDELMLLWSQLSPETQKKYLENIKTERKNNAVST